MTAGMFPLADCMNIKALIHCSTKKEFEFKKRDYKSILLKREVVLANSLIPSIKRF